MIDHETGRDKPDHKPHMHKSYCEKVMRFIREYKEKRCIGPPDNPSSPFCQYVCKYYKNCHGRDWPVPGHPERPHQPPLEDKDLKGVFSRCKCK